MNKIPPHSKELEEAILGSVMVDGNSIFRVSLTPDDFYVAKNRHIYTAMLQLKENSKPITLATLGDILGDKLKGIGGHSHLVKLANLVCTSSGIEKLSEEVKVYKYRRDVIQKAQRLVEASYKGIDIEKSKRELLDIGLSETNVETIKEIANDYSDFYTKPIEKGILTGINRLDEITSGMRAGELITITAPPSVGKTNLALNFVSTAINNKKKVLFINLEMDKNDVVSRLLAIHSGLDAWKIRNKTESTESIVNALGGLYETNFKLISAPGIEVNEIAQQALIEHRKNGLDLLVVDYLNRIRGDRDERVRIENSVRTLKDCALRLRIPIILPYQMTLTARRGDEGPKLDDARGSSVIGDESGFSIALTNESAKNDEYRWLGSDEDDYQIHVLKNRHGAAYGGVNVKFNKHSLRFKEC